MRSLTLLLAFSLPAVAPAATLKIVNAGIHQTEDGPLADPGDTFSPGETIYFSCQFEGYQVSRLEKVGLEYEFSALDPAGVPIVEKVSKKITASLSPEDKEWKPKIRQNVIVPPLAGPGVYKIVLSAKDEVSGAAVSVEKTFEVRGHRVDPSDTLVIRNFHFYRGEDDAQPLQIAAYRPGDPVWARFDITGYKLGEGNQREVAYTVTVTGPNDRVLLKAGDPTVEKGASFYPVKYVPCGISLNLQPNIHPGEYVIVIAAQDHLGNQTVESKNTFRVE